MTPNCYAAMRLQPCSALATIGTFAVNPFIFDKLPCDTHRDVPQGVRLRGDTAQSVGDLPAPYISFVTTRQARRKQVAARARIKPD